VPLPGFTAEASLERRSESYRMALNTATQQGLVPQWCFQNQNQSGSFTCCDWIAIGGLGGFLWCRKLILDEAPLPSGAFK
jgi:hypothetical protein